MSKNTSLPASPHSQPDTVRTTGNVTPPGPSSVLERTNQAPQNRGTVNSIRNPSEYQTQSNEQRGPRRLSSEALTFGAQSETSPATRASAKERSQRGPSTSANVVGTLPTQSSDSREGKGASTAKPSKKRVSWKTELIESATSFNHGPQINTTFAELAASSSQTNNETEEIGNSQNTPPPLEKAGGRKNLNADQQVQTSETQQKPKRSFGQQLGGLFLRSNQNPVSPPPSAPLPSPSLPQPPPGTSKIDVLHKDILDIKADTIVNAANSDMAMGRTPNACGGLSGAIHQKFGNKALADAMVEAAETKASSNKTFKIQEENNQTIQRIPIGEAVTTAIPRSSTIRNSHGVKHIVHAVAPDCNDQDQYEHREKLLESAYRNAFDEALKNGAKTIAVPVLGSGIFKGTGDQEFKDQEIADITARVVHQYQDKFESISVCGINPRSRNEPPVLQKIRERLNDPQWLEQDKTKIDDGIKIVGKKENRFLFRACNEENFEQTYNNFPQSEDPPNTQGPFHGCASLSMALTGPQQNQNVKVAPFGHQVMGVVLDEDKLDIKHADHHASFSLGIAGSNAMKGDTKFKKQKKGDERAHEAGFSTNRLHWSSTEKKWHEDGSLDRFQENIVHRYNRQINDPSKQYEEGKLSNLSLPSDKSCSSIKKMATNELLAYQKGEASPVKGFFLDITGNLDNNTITNAVTHLKSGIEKHNKGQFSDFTFYAYDQAADTSIARCCSAEEGLTLLNQSINNPKLLKTRFQTMQPAHEAQAELDTGHTLAVGKRRERTSSALQTIPEDTELKAEEPIYPKAPTTPPVIPHPVPKNKPVILPNVPRGRKQLLKGMAKMLGFPDAPNHDPIVLPSVPKEGKTPDNGQEPNQHSKDRTRSGTNHDKSSGKKSLPSDPRPGQDPFDTKKSAHAPKPTTKGHSTKEHTPSKGPKAPAKPAHPSSGQATPPTNQSQLMAHGSSLPPPQQNIGMDNNGLAQQRQRKQERIIYPELTPDELEKARRKNQREQDRCERQLDRKPSMNGTMAMGGGLGIMIDVALGVTGLGLPLLMVMTGAFALCNELEKEQKDSKAETKVKAFTDVLGEDHTIKEQKTGRSVLDKIRGKGQAKGQTQLTTGSIVESSPDHSRAQGKKGNKVASAELQVDEVSIAPEDSFSSESKQEDIASEQPRAKNSILESLRSRTQHKVGHQPMSHKDRYSRDDGVQR